MLLVDPRPSPRENPTVSATTRTACLALLTFAMAGIGCGQQDESHTNTGPETNANSNTPTPATEPAPPPAAATSGVPPALTPAEPAPAPAPPPAVEKPTASEKTPDQPGTTDTAATSEDAAVTLDKVTYDAFLKRMAENPAKARYTIVDAWATWCGPCKENFPHVVQMHEKYGDKGLAVASLSFDDPAESQQVEDARTFLREKKASFTNFLLDEEPGVGFEKFQVNAIPAVFIYGPDGKEVKRFTMDDPNNQFTYDEVEAAVASLLEGK
jgi:thiol-disulfide isomerase/thioredoxin